MSTPKKRPVRIGTSGWYYADWRGDFYPARLGKSHWFDHYAATFSTVELNNTFYRLPDPPTYRTWAKRAPLGFIYAVKAPRDLTHRQDADRETIFRDLALSARCLGEHLGPILYQFPPSIGRNIEELRGFLDRLPTGLDHVVEFRHPSWYEEEVRDLLTAAGVSFCIHDMYGSVSPWWVTGAVVYVRLHGPGKRKYAGRYGSERLRRLADQVEGVAASAREAYVFFNNTMAGAAVADALELRELMGQGTAALPGLFATDE